MVLPARLVHREESLGGSPPLPQRQDLFEAQWESPPFTGYSPPSISPPLPFTPLRPRKQNLSSFRLPFFFRFQTILGVTLFPRAVSFAPDPHIKRAFLWNRLCANPPPSGSTVNPSASSFLVSRLSSRAAEVEDPLTPFFRRM